MARAWNVAQVRVSTGSSIVITERNTKKEAEEEMRRQKELHKDDKDLRFVVTPKLGGRIQPSRWW